MAPATGTVHGSHARILFFRAPGARAAREPQPGYPPCRAARDSRRARPGRRTRQQARGGRSDATRAFPPAAALVATRSPCASADNACSPPHLSRSRLVRRSADRRYNRPFRRSVNEYGDRLWRDDRLYDFIVELDHNIRPRVLRRGSAVFMHVARPERSPTAGCVAMRSSDLRRLLPRIGPRTLLAIAV